MSCLHGLPKMPEDIIIKSKKSVALSGVPAGRTAICTVGRTGNDLHYRGLAISDLAENATFEEVVCLLIHGVLPTAAELEGYRRHLAACRALPDVVRQGLELLPGTTHPMDVLRIGCGLMGIVYPEAEPHEAVAARLLADRLM